MKSMRFVLTALAALLCFSGQTFAERMRIPSFQTQKGPDETAHLTRKGFYPVVAMPSKTDLEFDERFSVADVRLACEPGSRYEGWTLLRIRMDSKTLDVMGNARLAQESHNYYMSVFPSRKGGKTTVAFEYWLRSPDGELTEIVSHAVTVRGKLFKAGEPTVFDETIPRKLSEDWIVRVHAPNPNYYADKVLDLIKRCNIASCQVTFQDHIDSFSFVVVNEDFYDEKPVRRKSVKRPFDMLSIYQAASMSKVPCGYIFTKMADEGEVDLDTPLYKYYPGLLNRFAPQYREQAKLITGRMALTHTSGCGAGYGNIPLDFYPGYHCNYRNSNVTIVQYVIEYLKGKRIDEVAQDYIYSKRDMPHSRYSWQPEYDSLAVVAFTDTVTYNNPEIWYINDYVKYSDFPWDKGRTGIDNNTSYHWRTNSVECNRFWSWFLEGADLSEKMFNEFVYQGVHIPAAEVSMERGELFYGLATRTELSDELGPVIWHTGRNGPFRSLGIAFLERNAALSFFTNSRHYYAMYYPLLDIFVPHCIPMEWTMWVADAGTPVPGWETTADRLPYGVKTEEWGRSPNYMAEREKERSLDNPLDKLTFYRDTAMIRAKLQSILERGGFSAIQLAYSDDAGEIDISLNTDVDALCLAGETGALPLVYVVMRLAEEGRLDLDKPLSDYCPELLQRFEASSVAAASTLTARHCLSHISGVLLNNGLFKIGHTPGATYTDARNNYHVLKQVVEKIEGKTYNELCRDELFEPLGMSNTSYTSSDASRSLRTNAREFTSFLKWAMKRNGGSETIKQELNYRYVHIAAPEYARERATLWRTMDWVQEQNRELGDFLMHQGSAGDWKSLAMIVPGRKATLCVFVKDAGRINWYDAVSEIFFPTVEPLSCFGCGALYPLDDRK
ncbi:MAG: beta-lactamase family protein [Bacteroidales bacterium]|nr:beta-lactamase family protein [Bacteroidales bacterium]